MIVFELALTFSGYQSPKIAILLAIVAGLLFLPLLNEGRKFAWNAGVRAYGRYGQGNPTESMIIVIVIGAVGGAVLFGVGWWTLKSSYFKNPMKSSVTAPETVSKTDRQIADFGRRLDGVVNALTQSPSVDHSAQLSILQSDITNLSDKKNELTKQQREALDEQKLTLQSLEKGRRQYLEKVEVEKHEQELLQRRREIEQQDRIKKQQAADELQEQEFAKQYISIVDCIISTLYRLLHEIAKQSSETISSDFPDSQHPSIYGSAFLKDGKIVSGEHIVRVGSNQEWEFHVTIARMPHKERFIGAYLNLQIRAGLARVYISNSDPKELPDSLNLVFSTNDKPKPEPPQYNASCSLTEYKKPIERVLMELIQSRYNVAPLNPKP